MRSYLEGEPFKIVTHLQMTGNSYITAINLIMDRYENQRKLIHDKYISRWNLRPSNY